MCQPAYPCFKLNPCYCRIHITDDINSGPSTTHFDFDCPIYQVEEEIDKDEDLPEELARLLKQEEKVILPHEEEIEIVNLGSEELVRNIRIGAALQSDVKQ